MARGHAYPQPMWWQGFSAPDPEKPLLEQLLEARENLRRQLEVLQGDAANLFPGSRLSFASQIGVVSATLARIEAAIAAEEADEARS